MKGRDPVTSKGSLIGKTFINRHNHFAWTGGKASLTVMWIIIGTASKPLAKKKKKKILQHIYIVFFNKRKTGTIDKVLVYIYICWNSKRQNYQVDLKIIL